MVTKGAPPIGITLPYHYERIEIIDILHIKYRNALIIMEKVSNVQGIPHAGWGR